MKHSLFCLVVVLVLSLLACETHDQSTPAQDQEMKEKVANITEKTKEKAQEAGRKLDEATKELQHKAKIASEGVKEGWQRSGTSSSPLDINSASKDDIESLPGLGPDDAQRIVDGRPYSRKHDLVSRRVLSPQQYDKIAERITVK